MFNIFTLLPPALFVYYFAGIGLLFCISGTITRKLSLKYPEGWKDWRMLPVVLDAFGIILLIVSLVLYFTGGMYASFKL